MKGMQNHAACPFSINLIVMVNDKRVESAVAIGSFLAAVALSFTSLMIDEDHEIDSSVLMMCAQFLLLTATIFGLDYRISKLIKDKTNITT